MLKRDKGVVVLALVLATCVLAGCGGGGARSSTASKVADTSKSAHGSATHDKAAVVLSRQRLKNDSDKDQPGDEDPDNSHDTENDPFADYKPPADNRVYHDEDDSRTLAFGHPAGAQDTRAMANLVRRYYASALAGDGARACAMIDASLVKAIPEDYGRVGPAYLHGAKTCAAILSRLFKHIRRQLPQVPQVTDARVSGDAGLAFFGSERTSASDISLKRNGRSWKIEQLLGAPLT